MGFPKCGQHLQNVITFCGINNFVLKLQYLSSLKEGRPQFQNLTRTIFLRHLIKVNFLKS